MPQQIRGDDGELVGELRDDPVPRGRTGRDAVQQHKDRPGARGAVADGVAVEIELADSCVHRGAVYSEGRCDQSLIVWLRDWEAFTASSPPIAPAPASRRHARVRGCPR